MLTVSAPGSSKKEAASPKCCRATLESHHNLRRSGNVCSRRAAVSIAMTDQFYYTLLRQPLSVPDSVTAKLANPTSALGLCPGLFIFLHPRASVQHSKDAMNQSRDLVDALSELVCIFQPFLLGMVAIASVFGFSKPCLPVLL
jgi:hypothetical protein